MQHLSSRLPRKQNADNACFVETWRAIEQVVPYAHAQALVAEAVDETRRVIQGKRAGYGWSGGKDSQALRVVMEQVGVSPCVLAMACDLEYPAFLRWVTDHMPYGLDVIETEQDLAWLARHSDLLFPQDSKTAMQWFRLIQHKAQKVFFDRYHLDVLLVGRRRQDGNYMGPDGSGAYTNGQGVSYFYPLRDWTHEEVMAVCYYFEMDLPPIYSWPNGWVVGTGCWPARQWTGSVMNGWKEIWQIDPDIVRRAAPHLPSARDFLTRLGVA